MSTGQEFALSLTVTQSDGREYRWGGDEPNAGDIPQDLQFGSSLPGGDRELRCSLFRSIRRDNPDNVLFDDVRVAGPGNESAWQGRFAQFPRQHGDSFSVEPGAVGYVAELSDFPAFSETYRDIDLGRWSGPSLGRQLNLVPSFTVNGPSVAFDAGGVPALLLQHADVWTTAKPIAEALYDAGPGGAVAAIYADPAAFGAANTGDGNWDYRLGVSASDAPGSVLDSGDLWTGPLVPTTFTPASAERYGFTYLLYDSAPGGAAGAVYGIQLRHLAVYGDHGLTLRGAEPDAGFYASDVVADIVARCAPRLALGEITATSYPIPQLVFSQTNAADAIRTVNGFHLFEWGCYGKTFFWRRPDPDRLCWQARVSDGARLQLEGETADELFNGVVVSYQDRAGKGRVVGPPANYWPRGRALADATDTSLVDASPTNVVNSHGIPRKWAQLELSDPSTEAAAIQLGAIFLAEKSQPQRRGAIELRGLVQHPTIGKPLPVWKVKAGDWISVPDSATPEIKRRIIEAAYSHEQRSVVCTLDNSAFRLDALLAQLGAGLTGVVS